eukprot:CAMPEP_0178452902 /NCGR_PEP_ID=MMETSP0689_2-20121128/44506_1 /TAXON_ID=160604 /ORGANISM="Amphidinium massartii, Strain CS-259" /LENGTH=128 /DNA_ID=CAMNT_0020078667 /DNA_START=562 /DNA_END=948 /DNA_ORIENTATION=-
MEGFEQALIGTSRGALFGQAALGMAATNFGVSDGFTFDDERLSASGASVKLVLGLMHRDVSELRLPANLKARASSVFALEHDHANLVLYRTAATVGQLVTLAMEGLKSTPDDFRQMICFAGTAEGYGD